MPRSRSRSRSPSRRRERDERESHSRRDQGRVRDDRDDDRRRREDDRHGARRDHRDDAPPRSSRDDRDSRGPPSSSFKGDLPRAVDSWGPSGKDSKDDKKQSEEEKAQPNFGLSGMLAAETNTYNGVVLKYNEPPEARKPALRWRIYPMKGDDMLEEIPIHRQSAYLIGREQRVR